MLQWLPDNVSTFGQGVDNLFYAIYYITLIALILVMATLITFLIKYRHQEGKEGDVHRRQHNVGNRLDSRYDCDCLCAGYV